MKINELMIGDWVRIIDSPYRDETAKIRHSDFSNSCIQIMPIPLTPEILERNGFVRKGVPYEWENGMFVQQWGLDDINYSFPIRETPDYDGFTWHGEEINSVHTLQHALRLCGLNELADNFKI